MTEIFLNLEHSITISEPYTMLEGSEGGIIFHCTNSATSDGLVLADWPLPDTSDPTIDVITLIYGKTYVHPDPIYSVDKPLRIVTGFSTIEEWPVYRYRQSLENGSDYGNITFHLDASPSSVGVIDNASVPGKLRNFVFFQDIIQECRYYKEYIYDRNKTYGWIYDGIAEAKYAPKTNWIKPFKWDIANDTNGIVIDITNIKNPNEWPSYNSHDTNLFIRQDLLSNSNVFYSDAISITANQDFQIIDSRSIGILQILSHFIDKNVLNGTNEIWVDKMLIGWCNENGLLCEYQKCPEGFIYHEKLEICIDDCAKIKGEDYYWHEEYEICWKNCPDSPDGQPMYYNPVLDDCVEEDIENCWGYAPYEIHVVTYYDGGLGGGHSCNSTIFRLTVTTATESKSAIANFNNNGSGSFSSPQTPNTRNIYDRYGCEVVVQLSREDIEQEAECEFNIQFDCICTNSTCQDWGSSGVPSVEPNGVRCHSGIEKYDIAIKNRKGNWWHAKALPIPVGGKVEFKVGQPQFQFIPGTFINHGNNSKNIGLWTELLPETSTSTPLLMPMSTAISTSINPCIFMQDTGEISETCGCIIAECTNIECPLSMLMENGKKVQINATQCHPLMCRWFE